MFGFGTDLTFTLNYDQPVQNQVSVTVSHLNNELVLGSGGEGYLDQLGLDRIEREISLPQLEDLALGGVILKGPAYGLRFQYPIRLQQLSLLKYDLLQNMVTASRKTGKLIRLDDKILKLTDYGAQSRAAAPGTAAPVTTAGFTTYYPSLLVWIPKFTRRVFEGDGRGRLEFEAIEYGGPLAP
jgi:hypothetical protein